MTITLKENHVEEAQADLIRQFSRKEKIRAWLASYVKQIQELEVTFDDIRGISLVDHASDAQLDTIGALVGQARQGRDDTSYRTAILATIRLNLSEGTAEQVRALVRAVAGDVQVRFFESFPAGFVCQILDPIDPLLVDAERVAFLVDSARAAGVDSQTSVSLEPSFAFDKIDGTNGFDSGLYGAVF